MKTPFKPWILAGALTLGAPYVGHAQETLGGLGAAGAVGATLGAAGAGSLSSGQLSRGLPPSPSNGGDSGDGSDSSTGGRPGIAGASGDTGGTGSTFTRITPPELQSFNDRSGDEYVRELLAASSKPLPAPQSRRRSPRGQARYASRVSRQSKAQRSREVQSKYKIPPVSWRAAYLPQDRYKFGKIWRFVSTEDDRVYYTPSAMARRRFNPNRVIGFNSFQDALAAGYRPDPVSKPAPGAQITNIARLYRGPELYRFVEYVYSGQVGPESFLGVYNYTQTVANTLRPTRARPFIGITVAKILDAALSGDVDSIPREFTSRGPVARQPAASANGSGMGRSGMDGSGMGRPSMDGSSMGSPSTGVKGGGLSRGMRD